MKQATFWGAILLAPLVTVPAFHLLADSQLGARFKGLRTLDTYISRSNG